MSGRYLVEMRSNTWKFIEMRVWLNDESQIWWIFPRKSIHYLAKNKKWKIGHFKMKVSHKSDRVSHRVSHKNWRFLRVQPRWSCRGFVILGNHITYCSCILMFLNRIKHHKSSNLTDEVSESAECITSFLANMSKIHQLSKSKWAVPSIADLIWIPCSDRDSCWQYFSFGTQNTIRFEKSLNH